MADARHPTSRLRSWRVDLLLALAVLALTVPFLREWSAQPASRYLYTAAIVDDHTFQLDPYRQSFGEDYAVVDGHYYSDKAPYQPLLAIPAYGVYRLAGGEMFAPGVPGAEVGHRFDIALWLMTLVSCALPAAALAVAIRRYVARTEPKLALPIALALTFGTVILPFGSLLFGHVLAALAGFGAWMLLRRTAPTGAQLVAAGVLLGVGPGLEYPQVLVAAVVGVYALVAFRWRAAWVALGGFVALIPMMVINASIFGGPLRNAYQGYQPQFPGTGAFGVVNLVSPNVRELALSLVGDRGLLSLTPIMLVAVIGAVLAARHRGTYRADSIVALVLLVLFLLISTGVSSYGGSAPGPRYLVPIIPFFAGPLVVGWRRWPLIAPWAAGWGALWMVAATITDPLYQDGGYAPADWFRDVLGGRFDRSMIGTVLGAPAILLCVALAGGLVYAALRADRASRADARIAPADREMEAAVR